ncbi:MAG TPA: SDR family NAD(P)-dependent oxidoreductase [Paraburkholderia sp.]|jgi:NAD(P)-dependent dehydrogenase (short-subunit alcohol dehydrogenase family)|uniref:SDR family NAD(P)-dependent oxidoreductase n=1 Tax=Paraburkholderia sp. TaxID=1926495 RepID=UPI002B4A5C2E|nr:SDR family NAD(P)-dependent oxidoreductase [Paraburkholderia sp.]HKR41482.1 SDR family NAD(P)-dependent oxidoreductase [Paraburkholderia sp.]
MSRSPSPVVLVTGASRGIGAATAVAFARAGWRVAITARTQTEGQALDHQLRRPDGTLLTGSLTTTADAIRATGAAVFAQPMDLMDGASLDAAANAVLTHYGRVDLLINNAVYQDRETNAMLLETDDDILARTFHGNVSAPLRLVRRLLPAMVAQGGGQIVNVSSGAGKNDPPAPANQGGWGFAYGASKAALARMAGCLNREHGRDGIRAFSVNPGVVATQALSAALGDGGEIEKRYGAMKPEAIAAALLWLATDARAAPLAARTVMLDLQELVREYGLA